MPETPAYLKNLLSSASSSSTPSSLNDLRELPLTPSSWLGSPFDMPGWMDGSSSQPRVCQPRQSDTQKLANKFERMEGFLKNSGSDSIGEFLGILFYNPSHIPRDPRSLFHAKAVSRFLQGHNKIKMSDIISLIYGHKHSSPSPTSPHYSERHAPFSPSVPPMAILHARPSLFSWATNLVANHIHHEIHGLTVKDDNTHLRASTNGRRPDRVNLVSCEALGKFSIDALCGEYKTRAPVSWHLTESMAS